MAAPPAAPSGADLPQSPPDIAVREGLRLRPYRADDVDGVLAMASDEVFARWTTVPVPYTREHAERFVGAQVPAGRTDGAPLLWVVEAGGEHAGNVELRRAGDGAVEVGYGLDPRHRGRGHLAAALRVLLPWAADHGVAVVRWQCSVGNWASRRVAWAAGVRVEGTVRRASAQRGGLRDSWVGTWCPGDPLEPVEPWLEVPRVEVPSAGVVLRPWEDGDVPRVVQACTDPTTRRWLNRLPDPYGPEQARGFVEDTHLSAAEGRAVGWCVADATSGTALASTTLFGLGQGARPAEVGYWAHPDARGRGVVTAALRVAARHALLPADVGGLGLPAVLVRAEPGNTASTAVARRAGLSAAGWDVAPDGEGRPPVRLDRYALTAEAFTDDGGDVVAG